MGLEIFSHFLFERSEIIFEKSKRLVSTELCQLKFPVNMFIYFGLLESNSGEPKTIDRNENFVLFLKGLTNYF
jgi:hypothetical protein